MYRPSGSLWAWLRTQIFRLWTAAAVLAAYAYAWIDRPEWLTWWKRATERGIERACAALPYPWGDRIEATLGNFGLWVQITLAIVVFRILVWLLMAMTGHLWRRRTHQTQASSAITASTDGTQLR
ncbi:MAG: hypothetical protein U1E70_01305 [Acetobacteraceae bacterium]